MGKFISCVTGEEKMCHYISYLGDELGFPVEVKQDVYSSDSTPFADKGVPAVSFARIAPPNTATIHNRYDTMALMKGEQMVLDTDFLIAFAERMANAARCPVAREMPENISQTVQINGSDSSVNHWLKSRNSDMITVRTPSSSSQPEPISTPLVPAKTTISAMPAASMKMPSIKPADRTATSSLHKQ